MRFSKDIFTRAVGPRRRHERLSTSGYSSRMPAVAASEEDMDGGELCSAYLI